ncbi:hypothetical protein [Pseudodesulfovibrio mercurii]|uniref:hypothetical protein n=1 Tax=Pseudodesulfovibrio mercurii TaxID=641491 RepID=UPI0011D23F27|nr:hypothetical protein [Pseudodesulfovibrio mercurii]
MRTLPQKKADELVLEYVRVLANAKGFGLSFLEPYVILSKIQITEIGKTTFEYAWQKTPLFVLERNLAGGRDVWTVKTTNNIVIDEFCVTI